MVECPMCAAVMRWSLSPAAHSLIFGPASSTGVEPAWLLVEAAEPEVEPEDTDETGGGCAASSSQKRSRDEEADED